MQAPDDAKNQKMKRLARSHAVKQALESKRKFQQESGENFRATTFKNTPKRPIGKRLRSGTLAVPIISLGTGVIDPFQTLAVDSLRLQMLLSNSKLLLVAGNCLNGLTINGLDKARQAPEPVFSVAKELAFQDFHSVFRTGLVDPALLNAVMLSLAFAVNGGNINRECLGFQGQAMRHIRERMSSLDMATSESTIGAILLLAGIEVSQIFSLCVAPVS